MIQLFLHYENNTFKTHHEYFYNKQEDEEEEGKISINALFIVDLNYDHHLDLIVTHGWPNQMSIAYGYGNGSFQDHTAMSNIDRFHGAALLFEDVNNDSYTDLIIAPGREEQIIVYLSRWNSSFSVAPDYRMTIREHAWDLALGDFNTDGILDLVYGAKNGRFSILLGVGDGSFLLEQMHSTPSDEHLLKTMPSDLNEDGLIDLLIYGFPEISLGVMLNNGNGTFRNIAFDSISFHDDSNIRINDLNHDTHMDIAIISGFLNDQITIYYGYGNGSFAASEDMVHENYNRLVVLEVGDFNGDYRPDLVTAVDGNLIFLFNDC